MSYSVVLRYRGREYFTLLDNPGDVSFGTHKKDDIHVPGSADHLMVLKASSGSDRIDVKCKAPLTTSMLAVALNELTYIPIDTTNSLGALPDSAADDTFSAAQLYVSRVCGEDAVAVDLPYQGTICVGRASDNDIVLKYPVVSGHHLRIVCSSGKPHIEDLESTNHTYMNGLRITKTVMKSGDVLSIFTFRFTLESGALHFHNMGSALSVAPGILQPINLLEPKLVPQELQANGFPKSLVYHLSPRIRETLPTDTVVLSSPPASVSPSARRGMNWMYLLSSGAMMATSLAGGALNPISLLPRMAYMISPAANMIMSKKMSKQEKEQIEEYMKLREQTYQAYIANEKARIGKIADTQRRIMLQENLAPTACIESVLKLKRNLWERQPVDSDFLNLRLGIGRDLLCAQVRARTSEDGYQMEPDEELEALTTQIIEETRYVDDIPVELPLEQIQTVGIIGPTDVVTYELRALLVELTSEHSASDVRLVCFFSPESRKFWAALRWLPHTWDESGQVRFTAFNEKRTHTICDILSDVIRKRGLTSEDSTGAPVAKKHGPDDPPVIPHFVVIVDDPDAMRREPVYDVLTSNNPSLGCTTILLAQYEYQLPQGCQYIVDMRGRPCVFKKDEFDKRIFFEQDEHVHTRDLDAYARRLAAVELSGSAAEAEIPSSVTFLQGYGVRTPEELNIRERWESSEPWRTLAAPIGVMRGGKIFSLDVKDGDKSHGPHGLLAGTTGSGKSELLQTWILSMCVNFSPYDVNFVIIDYKGGGMSDLMAPLPHVVGKITNIDRNIGRSLVALKSELKRRQRLFAEVGVNNINKYQKAFRDGTAKVRLPHLILVTDEFAELKKEEPDFMKELNSVATIGRTLGVHMLLATQKPAGVVNDQINANSRFRICMKVQDVADSREMIKRSDAARITQSGRAYIRVGEDEFFDLFQSFYSAAEYTGGTQHGFQGENQVRIVEPTGNRITPVKNAKRKATGEDELAVIVRRINDVCSQLGMEKMAGPWLPELPHLIPMADVAGAQVYDGTTWPAHQDRLAIPIGTFDVPAQQLQGTQVLDFDDVGHYAVYGSPGSGKTTFLKSIICSLAEHFGPDEVRMEIVDAGSWSLSEFSGMPHVAHVTLNQDEDNVASFVMRMRRELATRKKAFLAHAVNSLRAYHETVSPALPAIVILVDQLGPLFETSPEFTDVMSDIAGSGAPYGIHMVYTNTSTMGLSFKFQQLVKGCVCLQMSDKGDYTSLVGPTSGISLPNCPGRALMKGNPPVAFHTAMYAEGEEEQDRHATVLEMCHKMTEVWQLISAEKEKNAQAASAASSQAPGQAPQKWQGQSAADVAMPAAAPGIYAIRTQLPLGTRSEDFEPAVLDLTANPLVLVSGSDESHLRQLFDSLADLLSSRQDNEVIRLAPQDAEQAVQSVANLLNDRLKDRRARQTEPGFDEKSWLSGLQQECLVIDGLPTVAGALTPAGQRTLRKILSKGGQFGLVAIASVARDQLVGDEFDLVTDLAVNAGAAIVSGGAVGDYHFLHISPDDPCGIAYLDDNESALVVDNRVTLFKRGGAL